MKWVRRRCLAAPCLRHLRWDALSLDEDEEAMAGASAEELPAGVLALLESLQPGMQFGSNHHHGQLSPEAASALVKLLESRDANTQVWY